MDSISRAARGSHEKLSTRVSSFHAASSPPRLVFAFGQPLDFERLAEQAAPHITGPDGKPLVGAESLLALAVAKALGRMPVPGDTVELSLSQIAGGQAPAARILKLARALYPTGFTDPAHAAVRAHVRQGKASAATTAHAMTPPQRKAGDRVRLGPKPQEREAGLPRLVCDLGQALGDPHLEHASGAALAVWIEKELPRAIEGTVRRESPEQLVDSITRELEAAGVASATARAAGITLVRHRESSSPRTPAHPGIQDAGMLLFALFSDPRQATDSKCLESGLVTAQLIAKELEPQRVRDLLRASASIDDLAALLERRLAPGLAALEAELMAQAHLPELNDHVRAQRIAGAERCRGLNTAELARTLARDLARRVYLEQIVQPAQRGIADSIHGATAALASWTAGSSAVRRLAVFVAGQPREQVALGLRQAGVYGHDLLAALCPPNFKLPGYASYAKAPQMDEAAAIIVATVQKRAQRLSAMEQRARTGILDLSGLPAKSVHALLGNRLRSLGLDPARFPFSDDEPRNLLEREILDGIHGKSAFEASAAACKEVLSFTLGAPVLLEAVTEAGDEFLREWDRLELSETLAFAGLGDADEVQKAREQAVTTLILHPLVKTASKVGLEAASKALLARLVPLGAEIGSSLAELVHDPDGGVALLLDRGTEKAAGLTTRLVDLLSK